MIHVYKTKSTTDSARALRDKINPLHNIKETNLINYET